MYNSSDSTHLRRARNKKAFDAVIQAYGIIKSTSDIKAVDNSKQGHAAVNPAMPLPIDFCCDVDTAVRAILKEQNDVISFYRYYIYEVGTPCWNSQEQAKLEQRIGQVFFSRKLWPVTKYFKTVRQSVDNRI